MYVEVDNGGGVDPRRSWCLYDASSTLSPLRVNPWEAKRTAHAWWLSLREMMWGKEEREMPILPQASKSWIHSINRFDKVISQVFIWNQYILYSILIWILYIPWKFTDPERNVCGGNDSGHCGLLQLSHRGLHDVFCFAYLHRQSKDQTPPYFVDFNLVQLLDKSTDTTKPGVSCS